jgi:hypothetical protein
MVVPQISTADGKLQLFAGRSRLWWPTAANAFTDIYRSQALTTIFTVKLHWKCSLKKDRLKYQRRSWR